MRSALKVHTLEERCAREEREKSADLNCAAIITEVQHVFLRLGLHPVAEPLKQAVHAGLGGKCAAAAPLRNRTF
eukprot:scaffold301_cov243-Pinguiococcus_pyrenoidosus.AAC.93